MRTGFAYGDEKHDIFTRSSRADGWLILVGLVIISATAFFNALALR